MCIFSFRSGEDWSEKAITAASSVLYSEHVVLDFDSLIASETFLTNANGVYSVKNVSGDGLELVQKLLDEGVAASKERSSLDQTHIGGLGMIEHILNSYLVMRYLLKLIYLIEQGVYTIYLQLI